jgi:Flp pilus assembly protein CpaB
MFPRGEPFGMEMEFKDTGRRRRFLMIVIGLALAGAAGYGALMLAQNGAKQGARPVTQPVLVAAHDIPARTTIGVDDVTVRDVPIDEILQQTYTDPQSVLGRVNAVPIYTDQQVSPNLFATSVADSEFSILGPDEAVTPDSPYWRAVAVEIPASRAVGGEIKAGQHVDLFVSVQIDVLAVDSTGTYQKVDTATQDGLQSGESTKITFQDLEVLKADPDNDMYVLKVDLHQAEQIYHVVQVAPDSFSIALRPDEDTRSADITQYGVTTDRLIMTYLFPVPKLIDLQQLLGIPVPAPSTGPGTSPAPGSSPLPSGAPAPSATPAPAPAQPTPTPTL